MDLYKNRNNKIEVEETNNAVSFNKKLKALKKYCPKTYKCLFHRPQLDDGIYEEELPTSEEFKFVYGQIKIKYEIKNGVLYYRDLIPSQFFIDGYRIELKTYKGIYFRNEKDKFKIDLFLKMQKKKAV